MIYKIKKRSIKIGVENFRYWYRIINDKIDIFLIL